MSQCTFYFTYFTCTIWTICICTLCFTFFEALDENSSVVRLQSGVVLEKLDSHLAEHGLMVPLDLGAKGSCQLGGNVSTNAGGLRLLRYYLYWNVFTYIKYFACCVIAQSTIKTECNSWKREICDWWRGNWRRQH